MARALFVLILAAWMSRPVPTFGNTRDDWSNYVFAVRERAAAAGVTMPPVVQSFRVDLGLVPGSVVCQTNVNRGQTNVVCFTNWAFAFTNVYATNFVATYAGTSYPVETISAAAVAVADDTLRDLLTGEDFVDRSAITNAGNLDAWRTSFVGTNWHWIGEGMFGSQSNHVWTPIVVHPTNLPALNLSNAWNVAGLPVLTNWSVATNTITSNVYGWTVGAYTSFVVVISNTQPRTNLTRQFVFSWEPPRTNVNAVFASAVAGYELSLVDFTTGIVWHVAYPQSLPADVVPTGERMASAQTCRVVWNPPWTNAPTNVTAAAFNVEITGSVFAAGSSGWNRTTPAGETLTIADPLAAATVTLAKAWADITEIYLPTSGIPAGLRGASLQIVFTAAQLRAVGDAISTVGLSATNLIERQRLLAQLAWTRAEPEQTNFFGFNDAEGGFLVYTSTFFATPPVSSTNAAAAITSPLFRLQANPLAGWNETAGSIHNTFDGTFGFSYFEHWERYHLIWPTSGQFVAQLPATASNLAASAILLGQFPPENPFPYRLAGGVPVSFWPATNRETVQIIKDGAQNFDTVTGSVTWAADALGEWTNRLQAWSAVTKPAGALAVTSALSEQVSADPSAATNWETVTFSRTWATGSAERQLLFPRPTYRTFSGSWLIQWQFEHLTNGP